MAKHEIGMDNHTELVVEAIPADQEFQRENRQLGRLQKVTVRQRLLSQVQYALDLRAATAAASSNQFIVHA